MSKTHEVYLNVSLRDKETLKHYLQRLYDSWIWYKNTRKIVADFTLDALIFFELMIQLEESKSKKIQFVFGPEERTKWPMLWIDKDIIAQVMLLTTTIAVKNSVLEINTETK